MLHGLEMAFQQVEQVLVGAARQHLGDEGAAFFQVLHREPRPGLHQPHGAQVIGLLVAHGIGRHVRQHQVRRTVKFGFQRGGRLGVHEIHLQDRDAFDRLCLQQVDADHGSLGRALAHHLRPAARCDAEVDHSPRGPDKAEAVVQLDQLVGRAAAIAVGLGLLDVRIVQLPLQPSLGADLAFLGGLQPPV